MATVEEIVRDLLGSMGTSAGAPLVATWINNRYRELVAEAKFRHLRKVGELSLPARVTAGAITATRGSVTITPDITAQAAWLVSPGVATHQYWAIRPSSAWYKVQTVDALAASITLLSAFAEENVTAGSYNLVKGLHPLATNARWIGTFMHTRLRHILDLISLDEMNLHYPGRVIVGSYPLAVCQAGVDTSGILMVEVYPPPEDSEILHYIYWDLPTALTISSTIPPQVEASTLKEGALIDYYRFKMAKAMDAAQADIAATWRNEMNAQEVKWDRRKSIASRADRGVDDVTLILQYFGGSGGDGYDPRTAHDMVRDRWTWPSRI